jgi:hypothetical protein
MKRGFGARAQQELRGPNLKRLRQKRGCAARAGGDAGGPSKSAASFDAALNSI